MQRATRFRQSRHTATMHLLDRSFACGHSVRPDARKALGEAELLVVTTKRKREAAKDWAAPDCDADTSSAGLCYAVTKNSYQVDE